MPDAIFDFRLQFFRLPFQMADDQAAGFIRMPNQIDQILKHTPGYQITSMDAICEAVQFLTSKGSYGVNGQFLGIDGGFSSTFISELNKISTDV